MKSLTYSAALMAGLLAIPAPAAAQRVPAATVMIVDSNKVATDCAACRTALATFRSQGQAFETRRQTLTNQLNTERTSIQTAVNALNGKQPDAALQGRIRAFEQKAQAAETELAQTQQRLQSTNFNILRQIKERLDPAVRQVMAAKGASVVLDAESTLQFSPALDATNDVVAAVNRTLTTISVTPAAQQQQARPQGR